MATTRNQLSYGSQGSDVTELQKLLNQNGYNLSVDGIVGNNTWGAPTKATTGAATTTPAATDPGFKYDAYQPSDPGFKYDAYQPSDAVTQAQALLQQQLSQKPGQYQSPWQAQLNDTIQKILNREKFSYDLNGDALYKQYKDQYMNQGKMAMMDTMGQAAAMTGGYGNSYAQSVGQQAYQGHLQQLNDKIPELYQLALSKYQMEGDDLARQHSVLGNQEQQEYGRHRDTVSDWNVELDRLQNQYNAERDYDYSQYTDGRDFAYGQYTDDRNFDYGQYTDDRNFAYGQYIDGRDFAYGQYSDDRAYDYQAGRDKVADEQWQKEFDEALRQFNFANKLGEFAPGASSGSGEGSSSGGSGGGSGGSWLNSDGTVNVDKINTDSTWWKNYAASNGLDPNTGKKASSNDGGSGGGGEGFTGSTYDEAAAYLEEHGQSAAGLMTQSVWQRHKNNNNSVDGEHEASSYKDYLAIYIYNKTGK